MNFIKLNLSSRFFIIAVPLILMALFFSNISSFAQNSEKESIPYNSNFLYKYGISPKVFNLLLSPMYQEEVSFSADWTLSKNGNDQKNQINLQMDYDPYYEFGNQLFVIVRDQNIYQYWSKRQIKKYIAVQNEKFKNLKDFNLVNQDDIHFLKQSGDSTIFSFSLHKPFIPWKIKHIGNFTGQMYLLDGDLKKISLNSVKDFKLNGVRYDTYTASVYFMGNREKGYLVDYFQTSGSGIKKGESYNYSENLNIKFYKDKEKNTIENFPTSFWELETNNGPADTLMIRLERSLPFLGNAARKAGYELPQPWGINLFSHFQKESYNLNNIVLNGINLSELLFQQGGSTADLDIGVTAGMADVWVLPFLNFSVLSGRIFGNTNVRFELNDEIKDILGWIGEPADALEFNVDVGGSISGVGMTFAGGYKNLFATLATQYMVQTTEASGSTVRAFIATPLIGLRMPKIVNVMIGAQYQYSDTEVSGSFNLSGSENSFSLNLEPKTWNFMMGIQRDISNHWTGAFQVGMGERKSSTLVVGYRF